MTCVVLITAHKPRLSPAESLSLRRCRDVLGSHDCALVCPRGLDVNAYRHAWPDLRIDFIHPRWQRTYRDFERLKVHPFIYSRYRRYDFVLFHELDAYVFRDELDEWCRHPYDYIGAPWFRRDPGANLSHQFSGVGNGGFSLRRTSAFLRVASSWRYIRSLRDIHRRRRPGSSTIRAAARLVRNATFHNNFHTLFNNYRGPEDAYWGKIVPARLPWFRVAPPHVALRFSFETHPALLYEMNGRKLPFACHAWQKWDPDFFARHVPELATPHARDHAEAREPPVTLAPP